MVRDAGLGLAVAMRTARIIAVSFAALSLSGAAPGEEREMLEAFEKALGAMSGIAGVICVFALVWAGFAAMADGAEERGGRARKAVVLAVVGLALVLTARGIAALIRAGVVPIPPG